MRNNRQNYLIIWVMLITGLWGILLMASAQEDAALDLTVQEYELPLSGYKNSLYTVAWSPDGKHLAISGNWTIWLYTADTLEQIAQLDGHVISRVVTALAWNPDGDLLASASRDKTIRIWDVATGETITIDNEFEHGITSIAWQPNGELLAVTALDDIPLRFINPLTGQTEKAFHATYADGDLRNASSVSWSPDQNQVVVSSASLGVIFDVDTEEIVLDFSEQDTTRSTHVTKWSPDGRMIAMDSGPTILDLLGEGGRHTVTGSIWDATTGELILDLEGLKGGIVALAWSPDGRFLAANSQDWYETDEKNNTTHIWKVGTWQTVAVLEYGLTFPAQYSPPDYAYTLAWSPDSRQLATVGNDNLLRIWTLEEGD